VLCAIAASGKAQVTERRAVMAAIFKSVIIKFLYGLSGFA
jgi:hypothetical protein